MVAKDGSSWGGGRRKGDGKADVEGGPWFPVPIKPLFM